MNTKEAFWYQTGKIKNGYGYFRKRDESGSWTKSKLHKSNWESEGFSVYAGFFLYLWVPEDHSGRFLICIQIILKEINELIEVLRIWTWPAETDDQTGYREFNKKK